MSLREVRKSKNMSQIELAEKAGIRQTAISQYENGTRRPTLQNAVKLANALDITLNEIFLLLNISQ